MRNVHQMIIDKMSEMIGSQAIRFEYNHVVLICILERQVAVQFIMHNRHAVEGHSEAYRPGQTRLVIGRTLRGAQVATVTVIAWGKFLGLLLLAHLGKPFCCAKTAIGMTRFDQLMGVLLVKRLALRLVVWPVGTANYGTLINIHTKPLHPFKQVFDRSVNCAGSVGVFDAQDKRAASVTRVQPAKQRCSKSTDMLKSRGAGRKAQPRRFADRDHGLLLETVISLGHTKQCAPLQHLRILSYCSIVSQLWGRIL